MARRSKKKPAEKWQYVSALSDLQDGKLASSEVDGEKILLLRSGDTIHAIGAVCPHHGAPLECGLLIDHILTCPWHTAAFDVPSGMVLGPPALEGVPAYEVRIKQDCVQVRKKVPEIKPVQLRGESGTFIIIGSGAAGIAAAITLRHEGFDGRVIMVTPEIVVPYDRTWLSKEYLAGNLDRERLFPKSEQYYRDRKIDILMGRQVSALDPKNRQIIFMDGDYLQYEKLLVASGGIPRTPGIPGTDLKNFFLLRNLDDADAIIDALKQAQNALIIGAGLLGLEISAVLRERGLEVHVVAPEKIPLAGVYGERVGTRIQCLHAERGVHFHLGLTVVSLKGDDMVREAELSDESSLPVDIVIAGTGIIPAVHFLEEAGIVENYVVPVDGQMRTKTEGIYAAGDIALVPDFLTGGKRRVEHWTEAMQQGQHAARCMLGYDEEYHGVPFFWSKHYDTVIRFAGYTPKVRKIAYRGKPDSGEFLAGYYRGNKLLAVAGIGRTDEFLALHSSIGSEIRIKMRDFKREERNIQDFILSRIEVS